MTISKKISQVFICFLLIASHNVFANEQNLVLELYNDKGLMGKQITTIESKNSFNSKTELSWNNRRVTLNESYLLNDKGMPVGFSVTGISAFGAPVKETFKVEDGLATWESRADSGQQPINDDQFYVAVDGMNNAAMVRALLKAPLNQIKLFPSGNAELKEIKQHKITEDGRETTVYLYAISGLNLNPQFGWFDKDGHMFALDGGGFVRGIRKGWSMETFEELKSISQQEEIAYFANLSDQLTEKVTTAILIKDARVLDYKTNGLSKPQDVLIENSKIAKIDHDIEATASMKVIDANGQTLIPGLWDMHGHISKTLAFNYIASGVTSVRDMGNSPQNMSEIEALWDNKYMGTNIYKSGFIDKQSDYSAGNGITVSTLEEAKKAVDWYADNGYIQIKTYSSMDPKWMKPLADHIHSKGLRLSGHVPAFMSAEQAVEAGFDEIQHINMLFLNFLGGDEIDTRKQLRFSLIGDKAKDLDLKSKEVQAFIQMLAEKDIEVDLTVSTFNSLLLSRNGKIDQEYEEIAHHLPPLFQRGMKTATMRIESEEQDQSYQAAGKAMLDMTKELYDAGVPILPGTDMFAGFTLLRELELYHEAGIPAIEVMKIGTINSAKAVGKDAETGSIEVGKQADLVLIDGNPLRDMSDLRKSTLVIRGDKLYVPEEIHKSMGVSPFAEGIPVLH